MTSTAHTAAIVTVDAEIACLKGDAETLSHYLLQADAPSMDIIRNIAWDILSTGVGTDAGPGNWRLVFSKRKGGRPLSSHPEIIDARSALEYGQAIPLGLALLRMPLDQATQRALAAALDPQGKSKWRLKFERPKRKGNPRTALRTEIERATRTLYANNLRAKAKLRGEGSNWAEAIYPKVRRELDKLGLKASNSAIRAARAIKK